MPLRLRNFGSSAGNHGSQRNIQIDIKTQADSAEPAYVPSDRPFQAQRQRSYSIKYELLYPPN